MQRNFRHNAGTGRDLFIDARRCWTLALSELLYGAGIWVDRLMWTAPQHIETLDGLPT